MRPDGWFNSDSDILKLTSNGSMAEITQYDLIKTRYTAFEAGADAMLEALKKNHYITIHTSVPFLSLKYSTPNGNVDLLKGTLVFIPEEE